MNEWISVEEDLPKESLDSVIGWDSYTERPVFVQYLDGRFQRTGTKEVYKITHWMPSPLPPKGASKAEPSPDFWEITD
jgi:hypothetical protein